MNSRGKDTRALGFLPQSGSKGTCWPFLGAQNCRVAMRKVLKITWLPGWSIGMDAEPSHWFCAHPSTICSVGHQLHHLMDELPMPCPALVPDFTSLQGPAKRSRRLRMRGLAEVLLKTQDRVGTGGRSVFQGCASAIPGTLQCGDRAAHPTPPPQLRAWATRAVCGERTHQEPRAPLPHSK